MNELTELALELQGFCEKRNWRFCLIGGLALQYWGEPRLTKDVDMTLMTGFGGEEEFIREWLGAYESRLPDASNFALANRVLLLRSGKGIGIDNLDWNHIRTYLTPLVEIKEAPEILTHLDSLVEEIKAGS